MSFWRENSNVLKISPKKLTSKKNPTLQASQPLNAQPTTTQVTTVATPPTPVLTSVQRYLADSTSKFFGVNGDDGNEKVWMERRRRLAIKLFGGVKDDFQLDGTTYEDSLVRTFSTLRNLQYRNKPT